MQINPIGNVQLSTAVLRSYETVLGALRGPGFDAAVVDSFRASLAWERLYIFYGARIEDAALRLARFEPGLAPLVPLYVREYMHNDPIRRAAEAFDDETQAVALRLVPADIPDEGYRRAFFEDRHIVERVSIVQRTKAGWRGLNIARHRRAGPCSPADMSNLVCLSHLILPMVDHHYGTPSSSWRDGVADIELRFRQRFPALTARERQVCARAAVGMSVEATALDLGISRTSVLTYRRRAYGRLRVNSPYGLAALVLH